MSQEHSKNKDVIESARLAWNDISKALGQDEYFDESSEFESLYRTLVEKLFEEENADV